MPCFFLLRVSATNRKYRLTETDKRRNANDRDGSRSESDGKNIWMQGCRTRQEIGESAIFVSTLFENVMNEGICGRFGRIGVKHVAYLPSRGVERSADR